MYIPYTAIFFLVPKPNIISSPGRRLVQQAPVPPQRHEAPPLPAPAGEGGEVVPVPPGEPSRRHPNRSLASAALTQLAGEQLELRVQLRAAAGGLRGGGGRDQGGEGVLEVRGWGWGGLLLLLLLLGLLVAVLVLLR